MIKLLGRRIVALTVASMLLLAGCGESDAGRADGVVTVKWWHIQNREPMRPVWQALAEKYMAANPNVRIEIQPIENDAFKPKLTTVTQSGNPPDIFQTWGGGVLAQQVEAELVKDITDDVSSWYGTFHPLAAQPYQIDGRIYGVPYDTGMVGFWYNKALFARAGIEQPPATWNEFLETVRKLKAAGITPIALAGKAKWPGHFYWTYLAMRIGGLDAMKQAIDTRTWNTPIFVQAGHRLRELTGLEPFQPGFLAADYATPDGQAALMGNGRAAMELMGQWAPSTQQDTSKDLGKDLGFFPFPIVEGGVGAVTEVLGGGGGFVLGMNAPAEAVDFLKFISTAENHRRTVATGYFLPVVKGTEDEVKNPHAKLVTKALSSATGAQLYLDQALPPAVGQQINDSTAELIAGTKTPEEVARTIEDVAKLE